MKKLDLEDVTGGVSSTQTSHETRSGPEHDEAPDDAIGYGRPPKETRWRPGESGNPSGRPKARLKPFGALLLDACVKPVRIKTADGVTEVPIIEAVMAGLLESAAKKDHRATKLLFEHLPEAVAASEAPGRDRSRLFEIELTDEELSLVESLNNDLSKYLTRGPVEEPDPGS